MCSRELFSHLAEIAAKHNARSALIHPTLRTASNIDRPFLIDENSLSCRRCYEEPCA